MSAAVVITMTFLPKEFGTQFVTN